MANIAHAAQSGNNPNQLYHDQIAVKQAARALLEADHKRIDKCDREFLKVASRHGRVNSEGLDRIARLAWILNGGRHA